MSWGKPSGPPPTEWQEAARHIVADCEALLWSNVGERAREYLHRRGLADDTLRTWRIGFCPEDGQHHGLHVDRGITIPWWAGGHLWGINVRTAEERTKLWPRGKPRYMAVPGSRLYLSLFGVDKLADKATCFIAEGEFDAMLLWQAVQDLADVLTLAKAGRRLVER